MIFWITIWRGNKCARNSGGPTQQLLVVSLPVRIPDMSLRLSVYKRGNLSSRRFVGGFNLF